MVIFECRVRTRRDLGTNISNRERRMISHPRRWGERKRGRRVDKSRRGEKRIIRISRRWIRSKRE